MKNKAKRENEKFVISNNQIINAFLLKKYHQEILPDADKIRLRTPINLREINSDIDPMYIGTAYFINITDFTKDEMDKMSIYEIAYRLNVSITESRSEKFIKKISYISEYGVEIKTDVLENFSPFNISTDIVSSNLTHINDLESMGLGSNVGSIVYFGVTAPTSFTMMKEKSGRIYADMTSRYPLT